MPKRTNGPKLGWCYLCRKHGEITAEDVVPTWLRKTIQTIVGAGTRMPPKYLMPLCRPCNHALGKQFEEPTAPLVRRLIAREHTTLTVAEQETLASWAFLKDLEFAMARVAIYQIDGIVKKSGPQEREPWRQQLLALVSTGQPPADLSLRIGIVAGYGTSRGGFIPPEIDPNHCDLASLHPVANIVIESFQGGGLPLINRFVELTEGEDRLVRIWPPRHEEVKVPAKLVDGDVDQMREELGHHPDNRVGGFTAPPAIQN
jgi:hypothetical protein